MTTSRAYQPVAVPQSTASIVSAGRREESSHTTRWPLIGSASLCARASTTFHHRFVHVSTPPLPPLPAPPPPRAVLLLLEQRQEGAERRGGVADEVRLVGVAEAEHPAVDVDLYAPGRPLLGEELRIGHVRADHEQRVAVLHELPAQMGPDQPDGTGDPRHVVGENGLA